MFRHGEYLIKVGLSAPPLAHEDVPLRERPSGGDFTERDRLVLNILQPHHTRLYRAAAARRRAYAALAVLEQVDEQTALVVLAARGTIDVATARAGMLLRAYIFATSRGVAAERGRRVATWGAAASRRTFTVELGCPSRKAR